MVDEAFGRNAEDDKAGHPYFKRVRQYIYIFKYNTLPKRDIPPICVICGERELSS
jgi:hypothetical protein